MKNFILLWLSIVGYAVLSFILLLRDEWALKSISSFYPVLKHFLSNARSFALTHHLNTLPTFLYALLITVSFFYYWRLIKGKWIERQSSKKIILLSLLLQLTLIFSYPVLSSDVFDYILNNRVAFVYKQDPWITPSNAFPNDPFINLGSWQRIPSVYGPVHHLLGIIPAAIGGDDFIRSVFAYKLIMIVASFMTLALLPKIVGKKDEAKKIALFAFNPLFLIEIAGNAHNDIIMVVFMIAGFLAFIRHKFLPTGVLLGLGAMVKLYSIVLLPLFLAFLWMKNKLKYLLPLLLGFIGTVLVGIWFMGADSLKSYFRLMGWVFTLRLNSLPNLLNQLPNWVFTLPFVILSIYILSKLKNEIGLVRSYVALTLTYLLFVVPLYWAWYPIWYLPFLSILPITKLSKAGIAFSFSSMLHYAVLYFSHRFNYQDVFWTIAIYAVLVSPPIYVYLFSKNGKKT